MVARTCRHGQWYRVARDAGDEARNPRHGGCNEGQQENPLAREMGNLAVSKGSIAQLATVG